MKKLKDYDIMDIEAIDDERIKASSNGAVVPSTRVYIKDDVDKEFRALKRKLWIARAKRAIEKIAWFKLWCTSISTMNPEDGARQEYDKWKKNLGKFLSKAEAYK